MRCDNVREPKNRGNGRADVDWEAIANDPSVLAVRYRNHPNPQMVSNSPPPPPLPPTTMRMPILPGATSQRKPKVDRRAMVLPTNRPPKEEPKRQNRTPPSVMSGFLKDKSPALANSPRISSKLCKVPEKTTMEGLLKDGHKEINVSKEPAKVPYNRMRDLIQGTNHPQPRCMRLSDEGKANYNRCNGYDVKGVLNQSENYVHPKVNRVTREGASSARLSRRSLIFEGVFDDISPGFAGDQSRK